MTNEDSDRLTDLLHAWGKGDVEARDRVVAIVYRELRRQAARHLRREAFPQTLNPSGLVHEAFLRLLGQHRIEWTSRAHFFGVASRIMRQILVDRYRARRAVKRGQGWYVVPFDENTPVEGALDFSVLDTALSTLAVLDDRQARLVELRFFGGLTIDEAAAVLEISPPTAKRDWRVAKAWLRREIQRLEGR